MSYTKGPWKAGNYGSIVTDTPIPRSDEVTKKYYGGNCVCESLTDDNARRILAEHIACQGITTEALEKGVVDHCVNAVLDIWTIKSSKTIAASKKVISYMGSRILEATDGE